MTFVGVCGGRDFADGELMDYVLQQEVKIDDVVIQGGQRGADLMAKSWAETNGNAAITAHANWGYRGKSAGMRRNAVIAALPLRLLIAFPGGAGTAGMVKLARAKGIEVLEVEAAKKGVAG